MHPDPRVLLADVEQAGEAIERFTEGMDQAAYASDFRTQAAVERKFEIIGEALNILSTSNPELAERVPRIRKKIDFRNLLIHSYSTVSPNVYGTTPKNTCRNCAKARKPCLPNWARPKNEQGDC